MHEINVLMSRYYLARTMLLLLLLAARHAS